MLRCLVASRRCFVHVHKLGYPLSRRGVGNVQSTSLRYAFSTSANGGEAHQAQEVSKPEKKGRAKAVHDFAFLISERNAHSAVPSLQTPRDIKGFYRAIRTKGLLNELSSEEFSALICLFGSLSLLPESPTRLPDSKTETSKISTLHPLTVALHELQGDGKRQHWAFVLLVAKDKASHGLSLSDTDNYWLMRAALEDAKQSASQDPKGEAVRQHLDRARNYYARIRSIKNDWSIHRAYLDALLNIGGPKYGDEIITRLSNLLSWNKGLHTSLHDILWRTVALSDALSKSTKTQFLHALRKKLGDVKDVLPPSPHSSLEFGPGVSSTDERLENYDAQAIRDYFVDVMFSFKPGSHRTLRYLQEVYPWALFQCRAALCAFNDGTYASSEEEDHAAWNNLILLSLTFASARKVPASANVAPKQGLDGGIHSQAQVLGWTVICSLAALSSEFHLRLRSRKHLNTPSTESIQEIARSLWVLWRKEEAWRAGAVMRSTPLICCASTTFMALAAMSGDFRLARALIRHISDSVVYPARPGGESHRQYMLQACAVHFAILTATTGITGHPQHTWDGILEVLRHAELIQDSGTPNANRYTNDIASAFLVDVAPLHPMLSHELLKSSAEHGMTLTSDAVLSVGKALADAGYLDLAVGYLKDERVPEDSAALLLDTILRNFARHRHDEFRLDFVRSIAATFTDTRIRPANSRHLQTFLQACLRAGYIKELMEILEVVYEADPTILRSPFFKQLVSTLVSHHHYRLLARMLKDVWRKTPDLQRSILHNSRLQYTGRLLSRSSNTSSREITRSLPFSIYVWPVLRDHIPFRPRLARLDRRIISLKLSDRLKEARNLDEKTLDQAIYLLVTSGRITAALKLLDKYSPTITTKAGNIILSASLRPRRSRKQYRQLRHASARLTQLVKERGFVPDRVTLNLLMKALLRWKNITPPARLRALFDRLTLNGYPIPDEFFSNSTGSASSAQSAYGQSASSRIPASRTIFGTDTKPNKKDSLPMDLKAFSKGLSFKRHVRPLYKMFIKAFKVRGDFFGARRVNEALKGVRENVMREQAIREEARRIGRIKAREKRLRSQPGFERKVGK